MDKNENTRLGIILPRWLHTAVKKKAADENVTITKVVQMFLVLYVKSPAGAEYAAIADFDIRDLFTGGEPEWPDD
jgi:hypothetical protein